MLNAFKGCWRGALKALARLWVFALPLSKKLLKLHW